jgi:hypothetical protein
VNVVQDSAFSGRDPPTWPAVPARDLPNLLRDGLESSYSRVLTEHVPDELARWLTRLIEREAARVCAPGSGVHGVQGRPGHGP